MVPQHCDSILNDSQGRSYKTHHTPYIPCVQRPPGRHSNILPNRHCPRRILYVVVRASTSRNNKSVRTSIWETKNKKMWLWVTGETTRSDPTHRKMKMYWNRKFNVTRPWLILKSHGRRLQWSKTRITSTAVAADLLRPPVLPAIDHHPHAVQIFTIYLPRHTIIIIAEWRTSKKELFHREKHFPPSTNDRRVACTSLVLARQLLLSWNKK